MSISAAPLRIELCDVKPWQDEAQLDSMGGWASGGFGDVFGASLDGLGSVIVKLLRPLRMGLAQLDDRLVASGRAAVLANMQAMLQFNHPHIPPLLGLVMDQGEAVGLVLPRYAYTLATWASLGAPTASKPLRQSVGLVCEVMQALAFLHKKRIIHRDLKPENILVSWGVQQGAGIVHLKVPLIPRAGRQAFRSAGR